MDRLGWGVVKALLSESDIQPKHISSIDGIRDINFRPVKSSWISAVAWLPLLPEYRKQYPRHGLLLVRFKREDRGDHGRVHAYLAPSHVYARMLSGASVGRIMNRSLLHGKAKAAVEIST